MEILVDVNGSDNGMDGSIDAAVSVLSKVRSKICLCGDKDKIIDYIRTTYVQKADSLIKKLNFIDAKDMITNFDDPAFAIKNKKESSIVKAYDYMKANEDTVFVSAGSTGAVMAGALLKLKRIDGVYRPALTTILPTATKSQVVLLDCGANTLAASVSMLQFAQMGVIYARYVLKKENVKVALLNIGAEEKKGSTELKEAYKILKESVPEFVGNIEARDILSGDVDIVVASGLMGNVALKAIEGTAKLLTNSIKAEFKKNVFTKLAASTSQGMLKKALSKYDYTKYGGAILLGVKKPVIKIHGNAKMQNYVAAILQAESVLCSKIVDKVANSVKKGKNGI